MRGVCEAMAPSLSSQTGSPSPAEGLAGNASAREVVAPSPPAEGPVEAAQASGEGGPSSSSTVPPTVIGALHCGCCGYAQPDADETCEFCGCGQLCDDCAWPLSGPRTEAGKGNKPVWVCCKCNDVHGYGGGCTGTKLNPAEGPAEAAQASREQGPSSYTVPPTVLGFLHCGCCGYAQPDADETCELCGCGKLCDDCAWPLSGPRTEAGKGNKPVWVCCKCNNDVHGYGGGCTGPRLAPPEDEEDRGPTSGSGGGAFIYGDKAVATSQVAGCAISLQRETAGEGDEEEGGSCGVADQTYKPGKGPSRKCERAGSYGTTPSRRGPSRGPGRDVIADWISSTQEHA